MRRTALRCWLCARYTSKLSHKNTSNIEKLFGINFGGKNLMFDTSMFALRSVGPSSANITENIKVLQRSRLNRLLTLCRQTESVVNGWIASRARNAFSKSQIRQSGPVQRQLISLIFSWKCSDMNTEKCNFSYGDDVSKSVHAEI